MALVASSTYFTYLLHMLVLRIVQQKLGIDPTALLVILSFVAGLAGAWAWGHLLLAARTAWSQRRGAWRIRFASRG
jgi:UPF0716 family protein affecting phage T7 exclusion